MDLANFIIAMWGAVLSTILVVRTIYKNRFRVLANTRSRMDGFVIEVINLSPKPIIIDYYNLFWDNKANGYIDIGLDEGYAFTINPNVVTTIEIKEPYIFKLKKGNLYIDFYIKGRSKPKTILVSS